MKNFLCCLAGLVLIFGVSSISQADLINFGVDIKTNATYSQVAGGFTGDDTGHYIRGYEDGIAFTFITTFSAGSIITGASLFIDAANFSGDDGIWWEFRIRRDQDPGDWQFLGTLADTASRNTYIPVLAGPLGATTLAPANDIDNSFFTIPVSFFGTISNSDLEIEVRSAGFDPDNARIDGANLQVAYTPVSVPEPGSLFLLGCGLIGLAVTRIRKKQ